MALPVVVVELVPQRLLDHRDIVHHGGGVLGLLLPLGLVNHVLLDVVDLVLNGRFVTVLQNQVPELLIYPWKSKCTCNWLTWSSFTIFLSLKLK